MSIQYVVDVLFSAPVFQKQSLDILQQHPPALARIANCSEVIWDIQSFFHIFLLLIKCAHNTAEERSSGVTLYWPPQLAQHTKCSSAIHHPFSRLSTLSLKIPQTPQSHFLSFQSPFKAYDRKIGLLNTLIVKGRAWPWPSHPLYYSISSNAAVALVHNLSRPPPHPHPHHKFFNAFEQLNSYTEDQFFWQQIKSMASKLLVTLTHLRHTSF